MDEGQLGLFGDGADGEDSTQGVGEASPEEIAARRQTRQLPIDQQALNVIGLAQARDQLAAGRRRWRSTGVPALRSQVAEVRLNGIESKRRRWLSSYDTR